MHIAAMLNVLLHCIALAAAVALPAHEQQEQKEQKEHDNASLGYFKLSAQKLRGSTIHDAIAGAQPQVLFERDDSGDGFVTMAMSNENTFYLADVEVGTPPQKVGVLIDTGSSDFWVVASNNTYCQSGTTGPLNKARAWDDIFDRTSSENVADADSDVNSASFLNSTSQHKATSSSSSSQSIDCSQYGTFDEADSSSFVSNNTAFSISYADGSFAKGTWGHDDVSIGGVSVPNLSLAVCDNADNAMGILGIGLAGLETTYSGSASLSSIFSSSNPYKYENLPIKLKNLGLIKQVAYSVYLNDAQADNAEILFGAIDHTKYKNDLVALPIINTLKSKGYNDAIQLDVTLNSVTLIDEKQKTQAVVGSGAAAALLDTGTTLTYVPQDVLNSILSLLDTQYSSSVGYYVMNCNDGDDLLLNFNFQSLIISIPLSSFLVPLVTTQGRTSEYCMVGIQSSDTDSFTLGDNFLRNVYMVADLENLEIALATADHDNTSTSNIEVMSTGIPSAVTPNSNMLWGQSSTVLSAQSNVQMSDMPESATSFLFQSNTRVNNPTQTIGSGSNSGSGPGAATATGRATTTSTSTTTGTASVSSISTTHRNEANAYAPALGAWGGIALAIAVLI
jgi:yapsin 1